MTKTVVVLQSNYIPWKGYFDLINDADEFIFYDDLQYTKNDWRNRNKLKTPIGSEWITIPAGSNTNRLICDVEIKDMSWQQKHWKTLQQNYQRSPHFGSYRAFFEDFFLGHQWTNLSALNQYLVQQIATQFLGIKTTFLDSRKFVLTGQKQYRLIDLLIQAGAERYISGPAAKSYIIPSHFETKGIELVWKNYCGYPEYPQLFPPFEHTVSILDLLFNVGGDAPWYIWGWRKSSLS